MKCSDSCVAPYGECINNGTRCNCLSGYTSQVSDVLVLDMCAFPLELFTGFQLGCVFFCFGGLMLLCSIVGKSNEKNKLGVIKYGALSACCNIIHLMLRGTRIEQGLASIIFSGIALCSGCAVVNSMCVTMQAAVMLAVRVRMCGTEEFIMRTKMERSMYILKLAAIAFGLGTLTLDVVSCVFFSEPINHDSFNNSALVNTGFVLLFYLAASNMFLVFASVLEKLLKEIQNGREASGGLNASSAHSGASTSRANDSYSTGSKVEASTITMQSMYLVKFQIFRVGSLILAAIIFCLYGYQIYANLGGDFQNNWISYWIIQATISGSPSMAYLFCKSHFITTMTVRNFSRRGTRGNVIAPSSLVRESIKKESVKKESAMRESFRRESFRR